jgi:hypothetical protein
MTLKAITLLTPNGSKLAFAFACGLIAGVGGMAKIAVDQARSLENEVEAIFCEPSQLYLRQEWHRTQAAVPQTPASPPATLAFPTNSVQILQ